MATETPFDHRKVVFSWGKVKKLDFLKTLSTPDFGSWNLILYTFLCTKIKRITIDNIFLLMLVHDPCERSISPECGRSISCSHCSDKHREVGEENETNGDIQKFRHIVWAKPAYCVDVFNCSNVGL